MECYYHQEQESVANCVYCNKNLCRKCASKFTPTICRDCADSLNKSETTDEIGKILIKSAVFFAIGFLITKLVLSGNVEFTIGQTLFMAFFYSGIPWGWSFLSRWVPLAPGGNAAFVLGFYLIKLIASFFVGLLVMAMNMVKILWFGVKRIVVKSQTKV